MHHRKRQAHQIRLALLRQVCRNRQARLTRMATPTPTANLAHPDPRKPQDSLARPATLRQHLKPRDRLTFQDLQRARPIRLPRPRLRPQLIRPARPNLQTRLPNMRPRACPRLPRRTPRQPRLTCSRRLSPMLSSLLRRPPTRNRRAAKTVTAVRAVVPELLMPLVFFSIRDAYDECARLTPRSIQSRPSDNSHESAQLSPSQIHTPSIHPSSSVAPPHPAVSSISTPSNGAHRMPSNQGHHITLGTSARDLSSSLPHQARVVFSDRPDHIEPCDGLYSHGAGELIDMCVEMDLIAFAPQGTMVSITGWTPRCHHADTVK